MTQSSAEKEMELNPPVETAANTSVIFFIAEPEIGVLNKCDAACKNEKMKAGLENNCL